MLLPDSSVIVICIAPFAGRCSGACRVAIRDRFSVLLRVGERIEFRPGKNRQVPRLFSGLARVMGLTDGGRGNWFVATALNVHGALDDVRYAVSWSDQHVRAIESRRCVRALMLCSTTASGRGPLVRSQYVILRYACRFVRLLGTAVQQLTGSRYARRVLGAGFARYARRIGINVGMHGDLGADGAAACSVTHRALQVGRTISVRHPTDR